MTKVSATREATAVIDSEQADVWAVLSDPKLVAELTPFVDSITAEADDTWIWSMSGLKVLGVGFAPTFTEHMTWNEPDCIEFSHAPPDGTTERAGVEGWYRLVEVEGGTELSTKLDVTVDLPIPRLSAGPARATMNQVLARMGDRFAKNLLAHLGSSQR